jgi:hypothetical protein
MRCFSSELAQLSGDGVLYQQVAHANACTSGQCRVQLNVEGHRTISQGAEGLHKPSLQVWGERPR